MEVDILISSAFEAIFSPCSLASAIGIPDGAKLRFSRATAAAGHASATKMIVRCDKPTASHLRRRFCSPRAYTHNGQLTSLQFVAMRPVGDHVDMRFPKDRTTILAHTPQAGRSTSGDRTMMPKLSSSSGVVSALAAVEWDEAAGFRVPGIAELHEAFLHSANGMHYDIDGHTSGGETRNGHDGDGDEDKLSETCRDRESEPPTEAKSEEKGYHSPETKRDYSSTDSSQDDSCVRYRRTPRHRMYRRPRRCKHQRDRARGAGRRGNT